MGTSQGWFVIVNPAAGGGRVARRWRSLERALMQAGVGFTVARSDRAGHAESLAHDAVMRGFRRLLAVGGDGTLNEVINGACATGAATSEDVAVGAAPLGSGNDWARALALPAAPRAFARCMAAGRTRAVDLGRIDFTGRQAVPARHFLNVAGAGIDAHLIAGLPIGAGRRLAYLLNLPKALRKFRPPVFDIQADGIRWREAQLLALVANGPYCGGGMRLAPQARPDDGELDLMCLAPLALRVALPRLPRLYDGRLHEEPWAHQQRVRVVEIAAEPPTAVQADGQLVGITPIRITVLTRALRVLTT
jgi:diacylglycerol kinase (ATP)